MCVCVCVCVCVSRVTHPIQSKPIQSNPIQSIEIAYPVCSIEYSSAYAWPLESMKIQDKTRPEKTIQYNTIQSIETYPVRCSIEYSSAHAWPLESTKRSRLGHAGSRGSYAITCAKAGHD